MSNFCTCHIKPKECKWCSEGKEPETNAERLSRIKIALTFDFKHLDNRWRVVDWPYKIVHQDDVKWFIEQTERAQELEVENEQFRKALGFYAEKENYVLTTEMDIGEYIHAVDLDGGALARQALEKGNQESLNTTK